MYLVEGEKVVSSMRRVDSGFWDVFDFDFVEGGAFTSSDEQLGNYVAVLSSSARDRLLGEGDAVGLTVRADGQSFTVVGVVEDVGLTRTYSQADLWVPIATSRSSECSERRRSAGKSRLTDSGVCASEALRLRSAVRRFVLPLSLPPTRAVRPQTSIQPLSFTLR